MKLTLPPFDYKLKKQNDLRMIFDVIRRKYVVITPEEWVRQHIIHYLINYKHYPKSLLCVEKEVEINGLKRRYDLISFDRQGRVLLVVECKAPEIELSQTVFDQAFEYNVSLCAPFIAVTNGLQHFFLHKGVDGKFIVATDIPEFKKLSSDFAEPSFNNSDTSTVK
ncbi:MAG: type I restriction enzyme HsdR N-terminal domain-containing protein [Culturomica sp.]|jgi:hypothetical protein|nr:type I restriction enzyme HsdR N-terminal domain-containing protein [Culturomica sp.]